MRRYRESRTHREDRIFGTLFVVSRTGGETGQFHGRVIAFGPAGPLKGVSAEGNDDDRHEQCKKGDAVDSEDGYVMGDVNGVRNIGKRRISLRLNAQIVVAGRDAGDHNGVILFAFSPGTVAVVAGVVAHFAAEVPGLSGVLIDERIV